MRSPSPGKYALKFFRMKISKINYAKLPPSSELNYHCLHLAVIFVILFVTELLFKKLVCVQMNPISFVTPQRNNFLTVFFSEKPAWNSLLNKEKVK